MKKQCLMFLVIVLFLNIIPVCSSDNATNQKSDSPSVLILLGEWFGDAYFPLQEELDSRGWNSKRVGIEGEYRGCYNKERDIVLSSEILIKDIKDFSQFDCLIIPSGPQFRKFRDDPEVLEFIRKAHSEGMLIASFCTGNILVNISGLTEFDLGPAMFPERVTTVKDGIIFGPRGGGPPPGDGYKSAPIKELCDAIEQYLKAKRNR